MSREARLEPSSLEPARELEQFLAATKDEGAVVSFVGVARPRSSDGATVEQLFLDHHPRLTLRSLDAIACAAMECFDVTAVRVIHRCGTVLPGEAIVFAAAASAHRRAAFEAADYLMDRLKTEAVFWKREDRVEGSEWIEPTDADHRDRDRWSEPCPE